MTNAQPQKPRNDLLEDCPNDCGYSTEGTAKQNRYRLTLHTQACNARTAKERTKQAASLTPYPTA